MRRPPRPEPEILPLEPRPLRTAYLTVAGADGPITVRAEVLASPAPELVRAARDGRVDPIIDELFLRLTALPGLLAAPSAASPAAR